MVTTPRRVDCLVGMRTVIVCCGVYHTLAIVVEADRSFSSKDASSGQIGGNVYAWGDNSKGQLGIGKSTKIRRLPTEIETLVSVPVVAIAAGQHHSVALSGKMSLFWKSENGRNNSTNFDLSS